MATCRKVFTLKTIETKETWERTVAVKTSPEQPIPWMPDGLTPEPEIRREEQAATEIRLELSEDEACQLLELLQGSTLICKAVGEALTAVLDGGKNFATRRGYGSEAKGEPVDELNIDAPGYQGDPRA